MNSEVFNVRSLYLFTVAFAIGLAASSASAEIGDFVQISLKSGEKITGTILEDTEHKIVLQTRLGNITFSKTIAKSDAKSIKTLEAVADKELDAVRNRQRQETPHEKITRRHDRQRADDDAEGGYVIIPAQGGIGDELTAGFFKSALERAERDGAELVVFHLDSPGGYVYVLNKIRDVLDDYADDIEIAFYIDSKCFSAAAMLSMSVEHMYVGPGARFGAAVGYTWNDSGNAAVDAKFNSALAATWRSYAEQHGRPGILIDAMILPETAVYADTTTTPWRLLSKRPSDFNEAMSGDEPRYRQIDSSRSILSLTYEEIGRAHV